MNSIVRRVPKNGLLQTNSTENAPFPLQQPHCQHTEEDHHKAYEARGGERVLSGTEGAAGLEDLACGDRAGVEGDDGGGGAD